MGWFKAGRYVEYAEYVSLENDTASKIFWECIVT